MVIIVFRSRINPGSEVEAAELGRKMYELATSMPGFVSYREYTSSDGEDLSLVEFESHENLANWRNHPDHVAAQNDGKDRLFSEYDIEVCDLVRKSTFHR